MPRRTYTDAAMGIGEQGDEGQDADGEWVGTHEGDEASGENVYGEHGEGNEGVVVSHSTPTLMDMVLDCLQHLERERGSDSSKMDVIDSVRMSLSAMISHIAMIPHTGGGGGGMGTVRGWAIVR